MYVSLFFYTDTYIFMYVQYLAVNIQYPFAASSHLLVKSVFVIFFHVFLVLRCRKSFYPEVYCQKIQNKKNLKFLSATVAYFPSDLLKFRKKNVARRRGRGLAGRELNRPEKIRVGRKRWGRGNSTWTKLIKKLLVSS